MGLYEHSDVVQWGMNLFGDPAYSPGYYCDITQPTTGDVYNNGHYFHSHYDTEHNQIENDEIIARALQEQFSRLDIADCSRYSQTNEEQFHASEPAYDWRNTSMMYCPEGHDYAYDGIGDIKPSSSLCCRPCEAEERSLELTDNYSLDDEIGRRLSQMVPIPHVPKINGEIPSIDEATSDHQRLLDRLQLYDFVEHTVQGDGNCQFRALSDQLYNTPDHHNNVRRKVVNQLRSHREIYEGYVPMEFGEYLEKMSKSGEWGDHVTLQAAADSENLRQTKFLKNVRNKAIPPSQNFQAQYCVRIFVVTSFKDTCCIEILPNFENPRGVIFLSFWAEVHYNSIYPQGDAFNKKNPTDPDIPSNESKRKKRWWNFGTKH